MATEVRSTDAAGADLDPSTRGYVPSAPALRAPLKLVIWDLDDTLWRGTLSEGEVELIGAHAEIVRELNRRGIVNSICSKNDFAAAQRRLEEEGLWGEFVFPSIEWTPKGGRVAQVVEDMQLRPQNVLFVDDNVGNLQEALHYAPELQIADVSVLASLLSQPQAAGKDDRALTRVEQYRSLERKKADRKSAPVSNEEFLRSCAIEVELAEPGPADAERLLELVNRSNQLNFTKSRLTEQDFAALLADRANRETRYVRVRDRYGDYGVSGFYSLSDGRLSHFVFSCRILHMGIEQWLYARLGRPAITIVGEVASSLELDRPVDWVTFVDDPDERPATRRPAPSSRASSRVLLKGGCDLFMLNGFLGGAIKTEFTYTSATGAEVHAEHTEVLRRSNRAVLAEFGPTIDRLPFLDRAAFASRVVRRPKSFGTLILSVLMDYTQGIYRLRDSDFVVPYGQYDEDATDPAIWPILEKRWGNGGVDRQFLEWFSESFEPEGAQPVERFQENIRWLAELLPSSTKLVLINGAEIPHPSGSEAGRDAHHRLMNAALEEVVAEIPNAAICDVRRFVVSPEDLKDNVRHYERQTYLRMAESLKQLVGDDLDVTDSSPRTMRLRRARRRLERTIERASLRLTLR
jgi:FkbH-like protein